MKQISLVPKSLVRITIFILIIGISVSQATATVISLWKGESNALDSIGSNDGSSNTTYILAKVGHGFYFDENTDSVNIPNNNDLNIQSSGFTADFWMKGVHNQPQSLFDVLDKSHGWIDSKGWAFQGDSSTGQISFVIGQDTYCCTDFPAITSYVDVIDGNFHHIAGTWDNTGKMKLYVDGILQGENTIISPVNNDRSLNMGFSYGGPYGIQRFFRGTVDEVEIHNKALNIDEINQIIRDANNNEIPIVTISTDKSSYKPSDKMIISLNLTNPGAITTVRESIWVDMPGGGKHMVMDNPSLSLSAGLKFSTRFPITLPNIPSGNYAWHAMLINSKNEIISESFAPWTFTGTTVSAESFEPVLNNVLIDIG